LESIRLYEKLLKMELYPQFTAMRDSDGRETNYKQTKSRLTERWVNTLERCGDCSLFGNPRDVAEAADDYRRALRVSSYLAPEMATNWERRLRYKWALALALPNSGIQDRELADEQLKQAELLTMRLPESGRRLEPNLEISEKFTKLILTYCRSTEPCEDKSCDFRKKFDDDLTVFREELKDLAKKNFLDSSLSRDDVETAMFAMRVILEDFPDPSRAAKNANQGRVTRLKDIELLLDYCRLGRRGGAGALPFVRPYYDCAIAALIKRDPKDAKQLIEVSHEAMTGMPHFKSRANAATLVFYCGSDCNYFFLDIPRGASAIYPYQGGISFEGILALSRGESSSADQLALPATLRKELLAVEGRICLCWRDEVRRLGTDHPIQQNVAKVIVVNAAGEPSPEMEGFIQAGGKEEQRVSRFPFTVPDSIQFDEEPMPGPASIVTSPVKAPPSLSSKQNQSAATVAQ